MSQTIERCKLLESLKWEVRVPDMYIPVVILRLGQG